MDIIKKTLDTVEVHSPATFRNLTAYPLIRKAKEDVPGYLTLDEGLSASTVTITEVSAGGSVPELLLQNTGDKPLLVIDGEEMVGAKQNRVINLTVMAGADSKIVIPVSCVEAGRWHHTSEAFAASPNAMHASGRRGKMVGVTHHLRAFESRASDQGGVWNDISGKLGRMQAHSESSEMGAIFEKYGATIDDFVRAFSPVEDQAGAIFAIGGRIAGLELFDHPATLARLYPKLVRSYALDALDSRYAGSEQGEPGEEEKSRLRDAAMLFVASVGLAKTSSHTALGLGDDIRISNNVVTGAALIVDGQVIHLSAFHNEEQASVNDGGRQGGMTSASRRKGFRQ
jgi:hypothetical protein